MDQVTEETNDLHEQLIDYVDMATGEALSAVDKLMKAVVWLTVSYAVTWVFMGVLLWKTR